MRGERGRESGEEGRRAEGGKAILQLTWVQRLALWKSDKVIVTLVGRAVGALKSKVELDKEVMKRKKDRRARSVSDKFRVHFQLTPLAAQVKN